jgi:hypothetical protein
VSAVRKRPRGHRVAVIHADRGSLRKALSRLNPPHQGQQDQAGAAATVLHSPAMQVLQRPDWYGSPVDLGELFILKKNRREAVCKLRSHQFGWELRLFIGSQDDVVQTQVCRSQDEALDTADTWKIGMKEKGRT